mgnify:CR=1 FL=1
METNNCAEVVTIGKLTASLEGFGLKHAAKGLADILDTAEMNDLTYREFLSELLECETTSRNERNRTRNYAAAHFPPGIQPLEEYDVSEIESGITESQIRRLKEMNWVDTHGNIIFVGPPGVGKTMLSGGVGLAGINAGYTVCFERMSNFVRIMDGERMGERKATFRFNKIRKAQMVILDEMGYTPISKAQAEQLFTFVSNCYRTKSLVFTTNKPVSQWSEIMGDPDLTKAMLDRILSHSACFFIKGESYRLKHPDLFA